MICMVRCFDIMNVLKYNVFIPLRLKTENGNPNLNSNSIAMNGQMLGLHIIDSTNHLTDWVIICSAIICMSTDSSTTI